MFLWPFSAFSLLPCNGAVPGGTAGCVRKAWLFTCWIRTWIWETWAAYEEKISSSETGRLGEIYISLSPVPGFCEPYKVQKWSGVSGPWHFEFCRVLKNPGMGDFEFCKLAGCLHRCAYGSRNDQTCLGDSVPLCWFPLGYARKKIGEVCGIFRVHKAEARGKARNKLPTNTRFWNFMLLF